MDITRGKCLAKPDSGDGSGSSQFWGVRNGNFVGFLCV